jgi:SAM-dependent methyltransferase
LTEELMGTTQPDDPAHLLYEEHAKTCAPDDFWGQVKRTVDGRRVDDDQIAMIVAAARQLLSLEQDDVLLDLCCGNGALTERIFDLCAGGHGVDVSPHLIAIAKRYFERTPQRTYEVGEVCAYVGSAVEPEQFTKAMCYGSFKYLSDEAAAPLLATLRTRFPNIRSFYIGNNADKALMDKFFYRTAYRPGLENAHGTFTGKWRTEAEFNELASSTGWDAKFHRMPRTFFSAHYCFDVVLTPAHGRGT